MKTQQTAAPRDNATTASRQAILDAAVVCLAIFVVRVALWYTRIRPYYFPVWDEFALLARSARMFHPHAAGWFTKGFRDAFSPYPGWGLSSTDFLRPVVNLGFWLNSLVFGERWADYLLLNYFAMAVVAGAVVWLARQMLRLPRWVALGAGCIAAVAPSFSNFALSMPTFMSDPLGAAFALVGIACFVARRNAAAAALFLLGAFTKETALYAPAAAVVVLWLFPMDSYGTASRQEKIRTSCLLLSPLAVYGVAYKLVFRHANKVYVVEDKPSWAHFLLGPLHWPFSFSTPTAHPAVPEAVGVVLSGMFWAAMLAAAIQWWTHRRMASAASRELGATLVLLCAALAMPAGLFLEPRFGVSAHALTALALVALVWRSRNVVLRAMWGAMLVFFANVGASSQVWAYTDMLQSMRGDWSLAREYATMLHDRSDTPVLLVDDMSGGYVAPDLVNVFTGHRAALVRVNTMTMTLLYRVCEPAPLSMSRAPGELQVAFPPHDCAQGLMLSPDRQMLKLAQGQSRRFTGLATIDYTFAPPDGPNYAAYAPLLRETIHCAAADACHVLAYDPSDRHYHWLQ